MTQKNHNEIEIGLIKGKINMLTEDLIQCKRLEKIKSFIENDNDMDRLLLVLAVLESHINHRESVAHMNQREFYNYMKRLNNNPEYRRACDIEGRKK